MQEVCFKYSVTNRPNIVQSIKRQNGKYSKLRKNKKPMKEILLYIVVDR